MLKVPEAVERMFSRPTIIFTVAQNPVSEKVIARLKEQARAEDSVDYVVYPTVQTAMASIDPLTAVALMDGALQHSKRFTPLVASRQNDHPLGGAQWGVRITPKVLQAANGLQGCVNQIYADFVRNFDAHLSAEMFPWGKPRKFEAAPASVQLADGIHALYERLNSGPNLARSIAAEKFALELPSDSRISYIRIPEPFVVSKAEMQSQISAFAKFEEISSTLVREDREVQEMLLAGVDLPKDSPIRDCYLFAPNNRFSFRRPDLHWTGKGVFASENDEMPGGFPEMFHLDNSYGLHAEEWNRAIEWLTSEGPLLFIVSHLWSEVYVEDTQWFVNELARKGWPVRMMTTDHLQDLDIREDGVYYDSLRVGTIWRQFPIFETEGMLAILVQAAHQGLVRMVPEFSSLGNKAWFSIFRSHEEFYRSRLDDETFAALNHVLPDSRLIRAEKDFPFGIRTTEGEYEFNALSDLLNLPAAERSQFVLKVCGANRLSARSYGVLMGTKLADSVWQDWIHERVAAKEPFIMQTKLKTAVAKIPVFNTKRKTAELFSCRVLLRPYVCNEEIVSISATAVPSYTERVHGMIDMAFGPVVMQ